MTTRQVAIRVKTDGKAEVQRDLREIGQTGSGTYEQIGRAADKASVATDRQIEKWRQLARTAKESEAVAARQAKFNTILGVGTVPSKSARESAEAFAAALAVREAANTNLKTRGLSAIQRQTLIYTASDVFASAASGINPAMIAMQQGPQVLQAFALEGGKAAATVLKLTGLVGGLAAIVGTAAAAWVSNENAMRRADVVAQGLAVTAGLTGEQIEALAQRSSKLGDVTVGSSRDMTAAYLSTGRIGGEVTERLIALTRRYAVATGQDAKEATQELARAMAEPAKGAEVLNNKLRFLDDTTVRYIQSLISQNKTTEAQIVLTEALGRRLEDTASRVSVLGGAWDAVKQKASEAWSAMGKAVNYLTGNQTDIERLAELRARQSLRVTDPRFAPKTDKDGKLLTTQKPAWVAAEEAEIAEIEARLARARERAEQAAKNQVVDDARTLVDRYNPNPRRLLDLQGDRSRIQASINTGELSGDSLKQAQAALAAVDKEIAAVRAGYSSAAAQATAFGRSQRDVARDTREAARQAEEAARNAERLKDIMLRDDLAVARFGEDKSRIFDLETEIRLRSKISELQSAGVTATEAQARAQRQIGLELKAEFDARVRRLGDPETMRGFVPTSETVAKWQAMTLVTHSHTEALKVMAITGERALDSITDPRNWDDWRTAGRAAIQDIASEFLKLALLNPVKNAIFGGLPGYSAAPVFGDGGAAGFIASLIGRNADGTDNWRGGLTWVGERGKELVNLPRGSQVFSHPRSMEMAGGVTVNITLNAQGAGPTEVQALTAEITALKRQLPQQIVQTVADAQQRRIIK